MRFLQQFREPLLALPDIRGSRVVRAVGKPHGNVSAVQPPGDLNAVLGVLQRTLANGRIRIAEGAVLVFLILEKIGIDRAGENSVVLGKFLDAIGAAHTIRAVPQHMQRYGRADCGEQVHMASAVVRLSRVLKINDEQIGRRTGKDRSTVINLMRLLQLPPDIQQLISEGKLTAGHGRCLLSLPKAELQREVSERAIHGGWSVRQVEQTCARMTAGKTPKHVDEAKIDPNVKAAIQEMERKLGTRIHVKAGARGRGRLEIEYYSAEDLDRIYDTIMGEA